MDGRARGPSMSDEEASRSGLPLRVVTETGRNGFFFRAEFGGLAAAAPIYRGASLPGVDPAEVLEALTEAASLWLPDSASRWGRSFGEWWRPSDSRGQRCSPGAQGVPRPRSARGECVGGEPEAPLPTTPTAGAGAGTVATVSPPAPCSEASGERRGVDAPTTSTTRGPRTAARGGAQAKLRRRAEREHRRRGMRGSKVDEVCFTTLTIFDPDRTEPAEPPTSTCTTQVVSQPWLAVVSQGPTARRCLSRAAPEPLGPWVATRQVVCNNFLAPRGRLLVRVLRSTTPPRV